VIILSWLPVPESLPIKLFMEIGVSLLNDFLHTSHHIQKILAIVAVPELFPSNIEIGGNYGRSYELSQM
jgi:hypothetical protein